jgi:hypothetical protein
MTLVYRNTDPTKWGTGKGEPLTSLEGDNNTWDLASRVLDIENNPIQPNQISNIVVVNNSQFKVIMSDGSEYGPFQLPIAAFKYQGEWQNDYTYFGYDTIDVPNVGLFLVLKQHVTPPPPAPFDPNFTVDGEAAYQQMSGTPDTAAVVTATADTYGALEHASFGGL